MQNPPLFTFAVLFLMCLERIICIKIRFSDSNNEYNKNEYLLIAYHVLKSLANPYNTLMRWMVL